MKYAAFAVALMAGVPAMAGFAMSSEKRRALLLAILVFAPVLADSGGINFLSVEHYRGPDRGFEVTVTDLVALALGIVLVSKHSARLRWAPFNTGPMAALFGLAVVSTVNGALPEFGVFTLFKAVRLYVTFWVVANSLRTGVPLEACRQGFTAAALYMTFFCVKQKYLFHMYRVNGPFDHSNGIPLYANLVIPALLVWAVGDTRLGRRDALLSLAGALGLVFSVVATQSRAGLVLAGGILVAALAAARWKAPSPRVSAAGAFVLVAMVLGGAMAAGTIVKRFKEAPEASEEARKEFNRAAELMAHDRWTGVGLNNFSRVLTDVPRYRDFLVVMAVEEEGGVAHHIYWLTAAELGFPALFVFGLVLVRFAVLALRQGIRGRGLEGALALAFFLGMAALHLQGLLEWGLRITPITFQFTLCVAVVVGLVEQSRHDPAAATGQSAPVEAPGPVPVPLNARRKQLLEKQLALAAAAAADGTGLVLTGAVEQRPARRRRQAFRG